ncbi:MAG TPA: hypothetical protein VFM55_12295 [Micromonosporaceae bacterium]|nr:hypothetical protein [Micromonosporaceae bacterium]
MTERDPTEEEFDSTQSDVEGHGVDEEDDGEAAIFDINFGCSSV